MPMTFPAHQGLILPIARRWPDSIDALALSVGAAMPDITDTLLGFPLNGYFKQWWGHSLIGIFTLDLLIGLGITGFIASFAKHRFRDLAIPLQLHSFFPQPGQDGDAAGGRTRVFPRLWLFSIFIGILSHIGFDLISHDTNLLFYPWVENTRWYPDWWYTIWFRIRPFSWFGRIYSFGVFSIIWGLLTAIGTFLFIHFLRPKKNKRI